MEGWRVGFLAEMQRDAERRRKAEEREQRRLVREYEKAEREAERQAARDEKERKKLYVESRVRETEALSSALEQSVNQLETLLTATLRVDDYIDLKALRQAYVEPPFDSGSLDTPLPEPELEPVAPPSALGGLVPGAKAKYEEASRQATESHEEELDDWRQEEENRKSELAIARAGHEERIGKERQEVDQANAQIDEFDARLDAAEPSAIVDYLGMVLDRSRYPDDFPVGHKLAYVPESKQVVVEHDLPSFEVIPEEKEFKYVKSRDEITASPRPATQRRTLYGQVIAQMALRTVHELFEADRRNHIETIVYNGMVESIDKRTGTPARVCVVSFRTTSDTFEPLNLGQVDPEECLKGLNAGVSKKPSELAPVRPVVEFKMVDDRFTDESDVISSLDQRPNLMQLTPSEFESLITNLFEKMGLKTRQTRPSRDGGVDCVAWDARPVMGGKVVIQAKRYKDTVGVSAVRDLFGTVHNEGAGKGILVTTSGYGKASFEFADGKPLELLDGNNLLYLLNEHAGIEAKIEPPEDWVDPDGPAASKPTERA
jgi:restriction system protein